MSWTADTPTQGTYGSTAPFTVAHTCSTNAKLLVVVVFVNGTTARAGGALTYNGATMTDSGQGFVFDTGGECGVEIWYLVDPDTGSSYTVSAPNTGTAVNMDLSVMSFVPSAGGAAYDNSNSASGTTQNPSLSLTVSATGNLIVGGLGSGDRDTPTAGTNFTLIHTDDAGNQTWGSEYDLAGEASPVTVAFGTARGDDWGLIGISFKEAVGNINVSGVSDGATVADSPTLDPIAIDKLTASDGATLGDSPTMLMESFVASSDGATIGDAASIDPILLEINTSDDLTVADAPTLDPIAIDTLTASDGITLGDNGSAAITGGVEDLAITAEDGVTLADIVRYYPDDVFIGESVAVSIAGGAPAALEVNVSDGATIGDTTSIVKAGWPEAFELDIGSWLTTQDTSGTGSTVTQSSTQAEGGTYSARCFTTNSGAKAQVRNSAFDSPWSGVPSANPGEHYWQRFSIFVPSTTASAITGSEYMDIGAAYNSGGTDGYFLRLMEGAALYVNGPGSSGQATFNLYATLPTDQWVSVELGLWSQATGDLDRAFAVLIDGAFYGWFTNGKDATDYDRLAGGIVATNSTDDLIVYVDNFYLYTTDAAPTGTDNRPTGTQYTLDYTTQSGENVGYHYTTWENGYTLNATYGLQPSSRIQSGAELSNFNSLVDGWSLIEMQWQDGGTRSWPPVGTGDYYCPMIAFHKSVELEENLEITFKYRSGTGTTDLVYQSWTLSGSEYATWQVPDDHATGESQPGQGDKIRVYWEEVSATEIHVVADYYDASADTWYLAIVDDTRALNNVNSVDFLDGDHLAVTNTIDSGDYAITYQTIGVAATYGLLVSASDGITLGESASATVSAPQVTSSDALTLADAVAMSGDSYLSVSDGATVGDTATAELVEAGGIQINVSDGATVGESTTLDVGLETATSDDVTLGESATADLQIDASASDGIALGESASAHVRAAWYNAEDLVINTGSIVSGTVNDTWTDNGVKLQLAETAGAPAFSYDFYFYDVPAIAADVTFNGYYSGNPGHQKKIQQYNFTTLGWTNLTADPDDFPTAAADYTLQFPVLNDSDYNSGGEVRLRIIHSTGGSATHYLYIDQLLLGTDFAIHVNDNLTAGDTDTVNLTVETSVSDDAALGESAVSDIPVPVAASESVTIGDVANATLPDALKIDVSDALTVGDTATVVRQVEGEYNVTVSDGVAVADSASAEVSGPQVIASDNVSVGESTQEYIGIEVSAAESLTVGEDTTANLELEISAADSVTVADSAAAAIAAVADISINVSDGVAIGDTAQADVSDPQISVTDALTVGESATVFVGVSGILYVSVSDNAVVADSASADVSDPQVVASDNLAVGDVVTVFISEAGAIDISVSDNANVSDTASINVSAPQIIASESLSIGESAIVQLGAVTPVQISVSDSLVIADAAQSLLGIDVSGQDNVIVTDGATAIVYPIHVIASDGLVVGEAINVTSVEVVWVIIDDFELHGGVVISDDDAYNVTVVDYET